MIKRKNKVYSSKKYNLKDKICKTTWSENVADKNFLLPNLELNIGEKDALSTDDLFTSVGLVGVSNYIKSGPKPNCDAYIDFNLQTVTFIASKEININEEIVYTLHPTCFDNAKIR